MASHCQTSMARLTGTSRCNGERNGDGSRWRLKKEKEEKSERPEKRKRWKIARKTPFSASGKEEGVKRNLFREWGPTSEVQ